MFEGELKWGRSEDDGSSGSSAVAEGWAF